MSELFGSTAAIKGAHLTWKIDKMLQHALQKVIINVECRPLLAHSLLVHLPVTNHDDALSRAEGATVLGRTETGAVSLCFFFKRVSYPELQATSAHCHATNSITHAAAGRQGPTPHGTLAFSSHRHEHGCRESQPPSLPDDGQRMRSKGTFFKVVGEVQKKKVQKT